MKRKLLFTLFTLLLTMSFSSAARADDFDLYYNLFNPAQTGNPGDTLSFTADLADTSDDDFLFITTDAFSLQGPITIDDTGLFTNFDLFMFPDEEDIGVLFTITLPSDIPTGTYLGTFSLFGGFGFGDDGPIGSQNFSITTVNNNINTNTVPEPSTLFLLGTGLTCFAGCKRKWQP
jgi:PEP-CTERM motif